jgi:hypothetical protein
MQNQYVGDVGDFAKLGLLRALAGICPLAKPRLKLRIVWYLTENSGNKDGRHREYLKRRNRSRYRGCDPDLYDALRDVSSKNRSVLDIERSGVLPNDTKYSKKEVRLDCDLLFLDPDNGLAPSGVGSESKRAVKYVFLDDIHGRIGTSQSVVLYQHLSRDGKAAKQARRYLAEVRKAFPSHEKPWAARFRRGTGRLFLVVPAKRHAKILHERGELLLGSPWGAAKHFTRVK